MGVFWKVLALLVGLGTLGLGLWPLSALCFAIFALSFRPWRRSRAKAPASKAPVGARQALASVLLLAAALAVAARGVLSSALFISCFAVTATWPAVRARAAARLSPVEDSILLRSTWLPFLWRALAEVKPGAEPVPRALSSFDGTLVFSGGGVYAGVSAWALGRGRAEERLLAGLRDAARRLCAGGAYLMPLDSGASSRVLSVALRKARPSRRGLPALDSDFLVLAASGGFLTEAGAYAVAGPSSSPSMPHPSKVRGEPVLWEVLEKTAKARRLPGPDGVSNLLESFSAATGEPIGERLRGLEAGDGSVTVEALGGDRVELTSPQLKALAVVYS